MREKAMNADDLETIMTVSNPIEAEVIRAALQAEGIACRIGDENQAGFAGIGGIAIEIMTHASDADRARKILLEQEEHN
jgi:hypothetical protein